MGILGRIKTEKKAAASRLNGQKAAGVPKRFSKAEIERRRKRMMELNEKKRQQKEKR